MSTIRTRRLVAYAHVANIDASIRFYAELGFTVANRVEDHWAWLSSNDANLMIALACGPVDAGQQAVLFYVYVDDVRAAHAHLRALGHATGEIAHPPWLPNGEFRMLDPDGYVLMIAQPSPGDA